MPFRSIALKRASLAVVATLLSGLPFVIAAVSLDAAANSRSEQVSKSRSEQASKSKSEQAPPPSRPMFFMVSLNKQHVSVYTPDGLYARAPVSTGRRGHATPTGLFTILEKERFHRSNIYSAAPMPFMQRITWSGVAMHEGQLPGYPASHGCVRLPREFAQRMFGLTQGNERVIISRHDIAPIKISHPRLPVPKLVPAPINENIASGAAQILQNALLVTSGNALSGKAERVEVATPAVPQETGRLLNPLELATTMKARASEQVAQASAALAPAQAAAEASSADLKAAAGAARKAEALLKQARERVESEGRAARKTDAVRQTGSSGARMAADDRVRDAEGALVVARQIKAEKEQEAAIALQSFKEADASRKTAVDAMKSWHRRLKPLSIFISLKTQRLYVRQGFVPVFDMPVKITKAEKPIGTHLFLAMPPDPAQSANATALQWLSLTIPNDEASEESTPHKQRRRKTDEDGNASGGSASTAASEALDRIEVSAEAADKISEMVWAGGSLIISDNAMSKETDEFSDFIILTR